jgi:hypothetical protein
MGQIKESIDSSSFLEYREGRSSLVSGANSISATDSGGVFVNGAFSISAKPTNIRMGAMYTFHPLTLTGIPSNAITPIPTFRLNMPVKGLSTAKSIVSGLKRII